MGFLRIKSLAALLVGSAFLIFGTLDANDLESSKNVFGPPAMKYATANLGQTGHLFTPRKIDPPATIAANENEPASTTHPEVQYATALIDANAIQYELLSLYELMPRRIEFSDRSYLIPSHQWLSSQFLPYMKRFYERYGLRPDGEGLDCDNIAHFFRQQLALSNALGGQTRMGDIPCAIIKTRQAHAFGGVGETKEAHSLILMRTNTGWHAIEPQTGAIGSFQKYPNRHHIDWALF